MRAVSRRFEELDRRRTPMGEIVLRRRLDPVLEVEVYEVKLDDEFLMSSLFTAAEVELARLALAETPGDELDVVVGGLGLGYTARAVLEDSRVRSLTVVEALPDVIRWHRSGLVPLSAEIGKDERCHLVAGDFFGMLDQGDAFGPVVPPRCHAVLVDIDHSPRHVLHPSHAAFYGPAGLRRLADRLLPGGVFALWSDDAPDAGFATVLEDAFATSRAQTVAFPNPYTGGTSRNTVYVATRGRA